MSKSIKLKMNADMSEIIKHLENLMKAFKTGIICLSKNNETVIVKPQENIYLEIEAEAKKDKEKLTIELEWFREQEIESPSDIFSISSEEPLITAPTEEKIEDPTKLPKKTLPENK